MDVRLLGPVEVVVDGAAVDVGPPQRCAVLAALAVDAGLTVPVTTVVDRVWGDRPSERVRRGLQAHVTRLRRLLEAAAAPDGAGPPPVRIVRRPGGYALDIDRDRVDLFRYRRSRDEARAPARTDAERVVLLRDALARWRGEPLAGVAGDWAARTRRGWQREHLDTVHAWACAELAVNGPAAVVGTLTELLDAHPFAENLVAVLMRARYAAGHPTEALDLYTRTRTRLVEELGTEPTAGLRRLQRAILRGDPDVVDAPATVAGDTAPAQLPNDVRGFAGRRGALDELDAVLADVDRVTDAVVISAISGTAGVGKTALAVHWAHRVAGRFPDGQLYVNLRGFDPTGQPVEPAEAVRGFLDALRVAPQRVPGDPEAQAALYRTLLAGRRMLVVLDNARDTAQVRPLVPGVPGCLVVVTSRNRLPGLVADGAHLLTLDLLTAHEARELLDRRLGPARTAAEPSAVDRIIGSCARLPLALAIVAARAAARPRFTLSALADELAGDGGHLDGLDAGEPAADVRAVLSWSYRALDPDAALLFRLVGLHPGPDLTVAAAAALAGRTPRQARRLLAELDRAHLIPEHAPGRYASHDLLRSYAAELTRTLDPAGHRRAAVVRMLDHYLHTGYAAALLLHSGRPPIDLDPPAPGVDPEPLATLVEALDWFTAEHAVLVASVHAAAAAGLDGHVWRLAWTLTDHLDRRGHWHEWISTRRAAYDAAHRLGLGDMAADALQQIGHAYLQLGRLDDAETHLHRAMEVARRAGAANREGQTHYSLAVLRTRQGRLEDALGHGAACLASYRTTGQTHGLGLAHNTLGWLHTEAGAYENAIVHNSEALTLFTAIDDHHGQGEAWDRLGLAHHRLGRYGTAVECFDRALDRLTALDDRMWIADVLVHLGASHAAAGQPAAARQAWSRALRILEDLRHPDADPVRARLAAVDGATGPMMGG